MPDVPIARAFAVQLGRFEECRADSMAAHALDPNSAETGTNIGSALLSLGRCDEALPWFDKALEIRPNLAELLNNKAVSLGQLHRFDDAFALYNRTKARKLNSTRTEWILPHLQLLTDNFEAGSAGRQARLKLPSATYPKLPLPVWLGGENVEGKTILTADEGSEIQSSSSLRADAGRTWGSRRSCRSEPAVSSLVRASRYRCVFRSQAGSCRRSTCTAQWATCRRPSERVSIRFSQRVVFAFPCQGPWANLGGSPRASYQAPGQPGLVRQSNPHDDHNRSIPPRTLSRILDVDATFVSLQKDPRPSDVTVLWEWNDIIDLMADLIDLSETAALVSCLDLVITVDTSVAHLAGALGCPNWILPPYTLGYRWLLDRDDSPWYPSALDQVPEALRARAIAFRRDGAYAPPCHEALVMQQD
jgi:hypothetical protein